MTQAWIMGASLVIASSAIAARASSSYDRIAADYPRVDGSTSTLPLQR